VDLIDIYLIDQIDRFFSVEKFIDLIKPTKYMNFHWFCLTKAVELLVVFIVSIFLKIDVMSNNSPLISCSVTYLLQNFYRRFRISAVKYKKHVREQYMDSVAACG